MIRPLYKFKSDKTVINWPDERNVNGNAGLWFDKYCNKWWGDSSWENKRNQYWLKFRSNPEHNSKLEWIKSVTKSEGSEVGDKCEIKEYAIRIAQLVDSRSGRFVIFTTESRFVTGLGLSHPVENGFAWHPTLGTPFLAGSSVKGLVLAWAKAEARRQPENDEWIQLFGSPGHAGCLCFFDALPVSPVKLEPDVMTPHYADWTEKAPPGDWMSPTPIPFLTVAKGNSFLFAIVPCRGKVDIDLDLVFGWLTDALKWAGGGAKTAVGYGRFFRDDKKNKYLTKCVRAKRSR